jgi:orotidine-5'-phosphate decarboxylase
VLTSFSQTELASIGIQIPVLEHVKKLALLAKDSGLDGVVCSAQEVKAIKQACIDPFITVTPGIRLASDALNDQTRVMTPKDAIAAGSDYLVVGRPITQSSNPEAVVTQILKSIQSI